MNVDLFGLLEGIFRILWLAIGLVSAHSKWFLCHCIKYSVLQGFLYYSYEQSFLNMYTFKNTRNTKYRIDNIAQKEERFSVFLCYHSDFNGPSKYKVKQSKNG